jgi:hypothetical protein
MSWKQHKSKEKHIIGSDKVITQDITVENLVKTQGINSNYFDGEGVLQSAKLIDTGSDYQVTSAKALVEFLRNNTLASFGSDPCGHWFRTIHEGSNSGNVIFPSHDYTNDEDSACQSNKGWKIGAYNANYRDVEDGKGTLEFISNVSFGRNMSIDGGLSTGSLTGPDASFNNIGSLDDNAMQIVTDASFQSNVEISNNLNVTYGEVSFNKLLRVPDASFNKIGSLNDDQGLQIVTDASFQSNLEISHNLNVTYGEVSFNKLLRVPDASFDNIGSLDDKALQIVTDASFQSNLEISNNLNVTYGEVSFNKLLRVPDASFNKIGSLNDDQGLQIVTDASFQSNVEISHNLIVTYGEVSFNKLLRVPDASFNNIGSLNDDQGLQIVTDASFQSNVEISNNLNVTHGEVSFNKLLRVPDASFNNIGSLTNDTSLTVLGDISINGNIFFKNNLYKNGVEFAGSTVSSGDGGGGIKPGDDASFTSVDISGKLFAEDEVSFNKLLRVPDASFNNIGSLDDNAMQIVTDASFQSNVEISNNLIVTNRIEAGEIEAGEFEAEEIKADEIIASQFVCGPGVGWTGDDGVFSRPDGQVYISVDDNFFFRDSGTSQRARHWFNTANGNVVIAGRFFSQLLDYAEMFEWEDGNPDGEDRVGYTVSLVDGTNTIKKMAVGDTPLGVVSGTAGLIGGDGIYWHGYWKNDEWGRPVYEQQLIDGVPQVKKDGTPKMKRKINPEYDVTLEDSYLSRDERQEWACVGLLGQVYIRNDCIKSPYWRKIKDVDDVKEYWLINLVLHDQAEKARNDALEARNDALEARNDALEARLSALEEKI